MRFLGEWFNAAPALEFGRALANVVVERLPPDIAAGEKVFRRKSTEVLLVLERQIETFKRTQTLNGYKRAKLANAFKWALMDHGYQQDYIDELTHWLLIRLS